MTRHTTQIRPAAELPLELSTSLDCAYDSAPTTSDLPNADAAGFSRMMERVAVEIAAVEHERLCEASEEAFGHSGVVGLRNRRGDALRARMAAELAVGK